MASEADDDILKILIATDIHLGYAEKDPVRGNDSLIAFEEILENARKYDVDFVLLGGDLYHENKPSRRIMHGCLSLLRNYCLGDRPVEFEFVSDQSKNFEHCQFPSLNYEDPNLNIAIPVFSIHGNHDDPTGQGNLCSLDMLHSSGFINYFGKTTSLDKIQISPLLFKKGSTKLAMYGLGAIRDERLHRMFLHKNVSMLRPKEDKDEWFNLFVIHQNRSKHGPTNHIPEQFLDEFLDLVFWGHEHECRIEPEWNDIQEFYVTQPGSSIATSLSEGETAAKYCGLLQIKGKNFKIKPIKLETVRQFYMEDVVLQETSLDPLDHDITKKMEAYCQEKVEMMLEKAEREHSGNKKQPKLPLIRLRVDYSGGFETFSQHRFGQKFVDRVANPKDLLYFMKKKAMAAKKLENKDELDDLDGIKVPEVDTARVEDMVKEYFNQANDKMKLQVLTEKGVGSAVKEFVDKEEKDAIIELVTYQLEKTQGYLKKRSTAEDLIDEEVQKFKELRQKQKDEDNEIQEAIKRAQVKRPKDEVTIDSDDEMNGNDSDGAASTSSRGRGTRGRGARGGRGSRGGRGRGESTRGARGGRGGRSKAPVIDDSSQRSITDSFTSTSKRKAAVSKKSAVISDSDSDVQLIQNDSSEDDILPVAKSSRKPPPKSAAKRGGIMYGSDSDDDLTPARKRRR